MYLYFTVDLPDTTNSHAVDFKNPVVHCEEDGDMVTFVDDATNYVVDKDPEIVTQKTNQKYLLIEKYMNGNKLVINGDKSHLVVMSKRSLTTEATEPK